MIFTIKSIDIMLKITNQADKNNQLDKKSQLQTLAPHFKSKLMWPNSTQIPMFQFVPKSMWPFKVFIKFYSFSKKYIEWARTIEKVATHIHFRHPLVHYRQRHNFGLHQFILFHLLKFLKGIFTVNIFHNK